MVISPIFRLPLQIPTKYSWAKLTCYSCRLAGRGGFLWAGWFTCVLLLLPFARWSSQGWRLGLLPGSLLFGFRILVFWVVILNMKLNYNCEHLYHTWSIHVHVPKTFLKKILNKCIRIVLICISSWERKFKQQIHSNFKGRWYMY